MNFIKAFLAALILSGFVSFMIVGTVYTRIEGTELNEKAFLLDTKPTVVYDGEGKVIAKFFKDRRSLATYEEIPKEIIEAIVATEDRAFYEHAGINVRAIARAAVEIAKARGEFVQGGSTITQQLIKRTHLDATKSIERKQQEAVYATILEKNFSKEEIMEMYLNQIYFGKGAYGIKDAMMTYFGINFEQFNELSREERIIKASLLAGLPQAPYKHDPYRNPESALKRRDIVIKSLYDTGKINNDEFRKTYGKPLMVLEKPMTTFEEEKLNNEELLHYALYEASEITGKSIEDLMSSGYEIHSTFDQDVYEIIREEYSVNSHFPSSSKKGVLVESSTVYVNPKNGEIIAFTGGRVLPEKLTDFNRAWMMQRQPGSTIKPIIAYGPALESGKFERFSMLLDEKGHEFPGGYVVRNWDDGGRGEVTMQEALRMSWNIPAVYSLLEVGIPYAVDYAQKLGIDFSNENSGLSMALGGVEKGVSPLEMADAYQAYANNGIRTPAHGVRKIVDTNGKTIYEAKIETEPVINTKNANIMKEMLQNVVANGTGRKGDIPGRHIGGKTGTTQHPFVKGKNNDLWFVGFDDELLVGAVWMGYGKIDKKHYLTVSSGKSADLYKKMTTKIIDLLLEKEKEKGNNLPRHKGTLNITEPPDTDPPIITLLGEPELILEYGQEYVEQGATAEDERDGDLTEYVVIEGEVDSFTPGTYTITYKVIDKAENLAEEVRTIIVEEEPIVEEPQIDPEAETVLQVAQDDENVGAELSWTDLGENVISHLYRNGEIIEQLRSTSFYDKNLVKNTDYNYHIVYVDKETNEILGRTNSVYVRINEETGTETNTEEEQTEPVQSEEGQPEQDDTTTENEQNTEGEEATVEVPSTIDIVNTN